MRHWPAATHHDALTRPARAGGAAPEFNFDEYVMKQAKKVEKALSESVAEQYPETIHEARPGVA